jgi:hypothetical protein
MEREHINAITSLARLDDWKTVMTYIEEAVRDIERAMGYVDPRDPVEIAKLQGARTAMNNVLNLENVANEMNKPEDPNES